MVVLRPSKVRFGSTDWGSVERISVDRFSVRGIEEWGDEGAHVVFADVARVRVKIRVSQVFEADDFDAPMPGEMEELRFEGSSGSDAGRRVVKADAVVESVSYSVSGSRSTRVISLVCVSEDGIDDPVSVTSAV